MINLRLRFPGGRYHATPWGHHVNEGQIEWPPSPWRLLRALLSTGYTHLGWWQEPALPAATIRLFERLSSTLPSYRLPAAGAAHSRHYMPLAKLDRGQEKTTLVIDSWARVGAGELVVSWDLELPADEHKLLETLATQLPYLGRAESLVQAKLEDALPPGAERNTGEVLPSEAAPGPGYERISLLAPMEAAHYSQWLGQRLQQALAPFALPEGKKKITAKLKKDRAKAEAPFPKSLLDALQIDTTFLHKHGWSQPPGTRLVSYWRPAGALSVAPLPRRPVREAPRVECVLLALGAPGRSAGVFPPTTRVLPQAELLHQALAGWLGKPGQAAEAPELLGLASNKAPLRGHGHAHLLSLDLDQDGHLDHILVWAPEGLGDAAQRALRGIRRTYAKHTKALALAMVASGPLQMLRDIKGPEGASLRALLGPPEGARVWRSLTPYVPARHIKKSGKNTLVGLLTQELAWRRLPEAAVEIEQLASKGFRSYVLRRTHGGKQPPQALSLALRLEFAEPQRGPIALGYASHFGLGAFQTVEED